MDLDFEKMFGFPKDIDKNLPVLVVDFQQDLRLIIAHQLSLLKFRRILHAHDAIRAVKYLRAEKDISIIICALELPDADGLEFLDEISDDLTLNRPPFCLTMFDANREKIMLAVEKGADEILVKPFQLSDVMVKVHRAFFSFHNPRNAEKAYQTAKDYLRVDKLDKAEELYQALAKMAPRAARPLVGLAHIARRRGEHDKALEFLAQAEKKNAHYVQLYEVRADIYLELNAIEKSLEEYRHAIAISPLNPIRYLKAASVFEKEKRFPEMIQILELALEKEIETPDLWHFLGLGYYNLQDYTKSIQFTRKALANDPENIEYLNQLALAHKAVNEFKEATQLYNQVIKLDTGNIQAQYNKAILMIQQGKRDEAKKLLIRLIKKYPDFSRARDKLKELGGTVPIDSDDTDTK